jgi:hypothetical protein
MGSRGGIPCARPMPERKGGPCVSTVSIVCDPNWAPAGVGASQVDSCLLKSAAARGVVVSRSRPRLELMGNVSPALCCRPRDRLRNDAARRVTVMTLPSSSLDFKSLVTTLFRRRVLDSRGG